MNEYHTYIGNDASDKPFYTIPVSVHAGPEDTGSEIAEQKNEIQLPSPKSAQLENSSVSVFDVAAYILEKLGTISTLKLEKLVYYCQAWSLVWDDQPLFPERIEAWVNGPVIRDLFKFHRGSFQISSCPVGVSKRLNEDQKETIDAVLGFYGQKTALELMQLTHLEDPWQKAREGIPYNQRSEAEIPLESMAEYYSRIYEQQNGQKK